MSIKHEKQMTLGNLVNALDSLVKEHKDAKVYFDFCNFYPNLQFDSYRGFYEDLCIGYDRYELKKHIYVPTISELLSHIKNEVLDKPFFGYKGGKYIMDNNTALWISKIGNSSSTVPTSLKVCSYGVIIETIHVDI